MKIRDAIDSSVLSRMNGSLAMVMAQQAGLKPFPFSAQKVAELVQKQDYSVEEVSSVIKKDPTLAAGLLKLANSPLFRPSRPIQEIEDAVIRLGRDSILELVFATIGAGYFRDMVGSGLLYRNHAIACGAIVRRMVVVLAPEHVSGAFVCGLLHDLGKLVFLHLGEELYKKSLDGTPMRRAGAIAREEREKFGYDHGILGGLILEEWKLFEPLPAVVALHHQPLQGFSMEPLYVRAAWLILADSLEPALAAGDREEFISEIERQEQLFALLRSSGVDANAFTDKAGLWFETLAQVREDSLNL